MPQPKEPLKPDIVSSIFGRQTKKRFSSLFSGRRALETTAKDSSKQAIKRKLPFGLDIGTNYIKVAQLGYDQRDEIKIVNLAIEELPRQAQDNPKERPVVIESLLKKIVKDKGLMGDCFSLAPRSSTKMNLIKLPQMPHDEIEKALTWEIKQTAQADVKEISLDYIVLDSQKAKFLGNQLGVLTVTALKKDVFEYLALLESAGLNPLALDIEPLADLAVLDYAGLCEPEEVVLYLDFGAGKTTLNIVYKQMLVFARTLNVAGNSLTKTISTYCGIPWDEAEARKKKVGLNISLDESKSVKNALGQSLEDMAQDIEHTFKYFSYQITQSQVTGFDKIVLSGGSSCLKEFVEFLSHRLNTEVKLVDPLNLFGPLSQALIDVDVAFMKNIDKDNKDNLGPHLSVALGLALRGVAESV